MLKPDILTLSREVEIAASLLAGLMLSREASGRTKRILFCPVATALPRSTSKLHLTAVSRVSRASRIVAKAVDAKNILRQTDQYFGCQAGKVMRENDDEMAKDYAA